MHFGNVKKIKDLNENVAKELGIDKYTPFPLTAKQVIKWDEGQNEQSPKNLLNAIWTITVNTILRSQNPELKIDFEKVAKTVKGEIIASFVHIQIKLYPEKFGNLDFWNLWHQNASTAYKLKMQIYNKSERR